MPQTAHICLLLTYAIYEGVQLLTWWSKESLFCSQDGCNDEDPQCGSVVAIKFMVKPSELVGCNRSSVAVSICR